MQVSSKSRAKVGDIIDLSRNRSKGNKKCPRCGKWGAYAKYKEGTERYTHRLRHDGLYFTVLEQCYVKPEEKKDVR